MYASFSPDRIYRYSLWRSWSLMPSMTDPFVNFICLNPSTADETTDDNTIRKCIKFSKSWGFSRMCVTNLFAFRATDPKVMKKATDPIGEDNDNTLRYVAGNAKMVIAAWSQHGSFMNRSAEVRKVVMQFRRTPIHYLRMGKNEPWHPLYLPDVTKPTEWITEAK